MAGLLDALDGLFSADVQVSLEAQIDPLEAVTAAVDALTSGPPDLGDLDAAIAGFEIPPEIAGLATIATDLGDVAGGFADLDFTAALAPILGPLGSIGVAGSAVGALGHLSTCLDVLRRLLSLGGGGIPGPSGLPLAGPLWRQAGMPPLVTDDLDPEEVRDRLAELESTLDALGPRLDGPTLVDLLRHLGPTWRDTRKWPTIPVLSDLAEVAGVAVEWSALSGPQLTAHLDGRLATIGEVIALPRTRVATPLITQCEAAGTLPAALDAAAAALPSLLEGLRRKVTETHVQPSTAELAALEGHVTALEHAAAALALGDSPLGRLDRLVRDLELALLRAVRAFYPAYGPDLVVQKIEALIAGIPAAEPAPLAEAVATLEGLDLSFLTGPLGTVRQAVEDAVQEVRDGLATVEQTVRDLLEPLADGLDSVLDAAGLDEVQATLATLPQTLTDFVDGEIRPAMEPLRDAVSAAVDALVDAAAAFDPETLIEPLQAAITELADLVGSDEVRGVRDQVTEGLAAAVATLEDLDFSAAADVSIDLIVDLEEAVAGIDPDDIPEPVRPLLAQVIQVVAGIDFTAEVSAPAVERATAAVAEGPRQVLVALQASMDDLRAAVERFKPSIVVGETLDQPFAQALGALETFTPSALLGTLVDALRDLTDRLSIADPDAIVGPLVGIHGQLTAAVDALRPSTLLAPVDAEIAAAIERLFEATGVDTVFDGIDDVLGPISTHLEAVVAARGVLGRIADLLADPGDVGTALGSLTDAIVDRLDAVDLAALGDRFDDLAAKVASVTAASLAADLAPALRTAQRAQPAIGGAAARAITDLALAFPLEAVEAQRSVPSRRRLADAVRRLRGAMEAVAAAATPWAALAGEIDALAPQLTARLGTYGRLSVIDGRSVFAECATPPSREVLRETVAEAVRDALEVPVTALFGLFAALAPHVSGFVAGLGDIVGVLHAQLDAIVGAEGIGGIADGLEEAADLLRDLDLSPLTTPLDEVWGRLSTAVGALDPAPLAAAIQAAADAVASLLDLSALLDPADVEALDAAYGGALDALRALAPSAVVGEVLDPVYEDLLADLLPLLDLPGILADLLASVGVGLAAEVTAQLERVEAAFDAMLRALPLSGGLSGSISVSASVSVSGGAG